MIPGAGGTAVQVDHAGELGGLRIVAQGAVLFRRGVPYLLGQDPDRAAAARWRGRRKSEPGTRGSAGHVCGPYVVQECFRASGTVGAVAVGVGDLGQGGIQDGEVLGGCVDGLQHVAGGRCLLLLRVTGHQSGADVQNQTGQVAPPARAAGMPFSVSSTCSQAASPAAAQVASGAARAAGSMPTSSSQAVGGDHPNETAHSNPPRIVAGAAAAVGEGSGQAGGIGEIGRQAGPGMADHSATVGRGDKLEA